MGKNHTRISLEKQEFLRSNFDGVVQREVFNTLCGALIGIGVGRYVFENRQDPRTVIKIENTACSFQNVHEADVWEMHRNTSVGKKWLAPCKWLSSCGVVLIQARTKPVPDGFKLPAHVPNIFTDLKRDNWGLYKGRLVCHDYGRHDALYHASRGQNMRRAQWLDAVDGHFRVYNG